MLGVSGDGLFGGESAETLGRFADQTRVTFPILLGDRSRAAYADGDHSISPFPFDVVIDREGRVRYMATRFDGPAMRVTIDKLLAE